MKTTRHGFTLVELSIVLVILGLLIGGVLTGQSLIKAAELRSVSTDLHRYNAATMTFRDKYLALPGDMPNAVRYWGAQAGATTDGRSNPCVLLTVAATGTATCNGNGDGWISGDAGHCAVDVYEKNRYWQHLANAGLIEGSYFGAVEDTTGAYSCRTSIPGKHVARSRISGVGYTALHIGGSITPLGDAGANIMWVGTTALVAGVYLETFGPAFKNEDVYNLDMKLDDGKPYTGSLRTPNRNYFGNYCTTDNTATATYDFTYPGAVCAFAYYPGW